MPEPTTTEEIAAIQMRLSETYNDPNEVMVCWSFTFCHICGSFAEACNCSCRPWNWSWNDRQAWHRCGEPPYHPLQIPVVGF